MNKFGIVVISTVVGAFIGGGLTNGNDAGVVAGAVLGFLGSSIYAFTKTADIVKNKIDASSTKSLHEEMIRTKELYDKGILSEDEYNEKINEMKKKMN